MLKNSIGFIFSLLISLIIIEIFVQKAEIEIPSTTDFDNVIGRKRRANMDFTFFSEGFSMGHFNKSSYLGPGNEHKRDTNVFRIAILGDSYVESFQVFRRDQFHSIIEEQLSQRIDKPVEVLNFGRSGFDLADMYVYQQRFVNQFNPDFVLYFLSTADLKCTQTDPLIPKVIIKDSVLVVTNDLFPQQYLETFQKTKVLTQNSSIFQMMNNARKLVKAGEFWPKMLDKFYQEDIIPAVTEKKEVTLPEIAYVIEENLSSNTIVLNRGNDQLPIKFMEVLKENNIQFIDINDTLDVLREQGIDPNYWKVTNTKGHWNHQAHMAIGNYLTGQLTELVKENPDYQERFK